MAIWVDGRSLRYRGCRRRVNTCVHSGTRMLATPVTSPDRFAASELRGWPRLFLERAGLVFENMTCIWFAMSGDRGVSDVIKSINQTRYLQISVFKCPLSSFPEIGQSTSTKVGKIVRSRMI